MANSATEIVNQALQMIGDNVPAVTGTSPNFDSSPEGVAARYLYPQTVAEVGRLFEWDMARNTVALVPSGNTAPFPWDFEYLYPSNGIEVWQLTPTSLPDPFNPLPTTWVVANTLVGGVQKKVIQTDLSAALCVYNNNPGPSVWDAGFTEAVVRLLASKFAQAVAGKPETASALLDSFNAFMAAARTRVD